MTSIKVCQALETAVRDARAEVEVNSRMRRTISGGSAVRGSLPGEVVVILRGQLVFLGVEEKKLRGVHDSAILILLTAFDNTR